MPGTNYTTNLRLANPSLNDTGWGTTVSSGMIDLTDQAIAGLATADVTLGDVTLTIVDGSAGVNSARNMFLNITGAPGVARAVIVPTNRKLYFVTNNCGQIATVKVSGQTGVAVPAGASMTLQINAAGTDVAPAFTYAASMSLGTALPATSGGTGQASYAVGDLLYASTTTALSKLTVGATNAVLTVAAGIPSWVTTLPVASGGTGAATLALNNVLLGNDTGAVQTVAPGTAGNVLTSVGGTWASAAAPSSYAGPNSQTFDASGTFTVPAGVTTVYVAVMAGGGGGSGGNGNNTLSGGGVGGAGGAAFARVSGLTPLSTVSVTVGSGGAGSAGANGTPSAGSAGNTSSFGSHVSCTGGAGGPSAGGTGAAGTVTTGGSATLLVRRGPSLGLTATGAVGNSGTSGCGTTAGGGGGAGSGGGGGGGNTAVSGNGGTGGLTNGVGAAGSNASSGSGAAGGAGGAGVQGGAANGGAAGAGGANQSGGGGGGGGGAVVVFW